MPWVMAVIFLILFPCSFYATRKLVLHRPRWGNSIAGICLLFVLLHLFLFYYPMVEFTLIGWHGYMFIQPFWMPIFAFGLMGVAHAALRLKRQKYGVVALTATIGLFFLLRLATTTFFQARHMTGQPAGMEKVCHQTTGYTCGAAAASTLLAQVGIPSTEQEMADLCGTNSMTGTQVVGVLWGLREKLRGSGYTLECRSHQTLADLQGLQYPAMAIMKLNFLIDHWIVVIGADDRGILTGDPLRGLALRETPEFLQKFRGTLVCLVPADPQRAPPPPPMRQVWPELPPEQVDPAVPPAVQNEIEPATASPEKH